MAIDERIFINEKRDIGNGYYNKDTIDIMDTLVQTLTHDYNFKGDVNYILLNDIVTFNTRVISNKNYKSGPIILHGHVVFEDLDVSLEVDIPCVFENGDWYFYNKNPYNAPKICISDSLSQGEERGYLDRKDANLVAHVLFGDAIRFFYPKSEKAKTHSLRYTGGISYITSDGKYDVNQKTLFEGTPEIETEWLLKGELKNKGVAGRLEIVRDRLEKKDPRFAVVWDYLINGRRIDLDQSSNELAEALAQVSEIEETVAARRHK